VQILRSLNKRFRDLVLLDWLLIAALLIALVILIRLFAQRYLQLMEGYLLSWNSIRLAWSFSLNHGYKLYYPMDSGPVISVLYGPIFPLTYCFLSFIHSPTFAIISASFISCCFFFLPVLWMHLFYGQIAQKKTLCAAVAFLTFCFLAITSRELSYSALCVHADALALAMATVACAFLFRLKNLNNIWPLVYSSIFSVLAVWTKQTLIPIFIALPVYILLAYGYRCMLRYLLCLCITFISISAIIFTFFDVRDLWFHTITLPLSSPWRLQGGRLVNLYTACNVLIKKCSRFVLLLGVYSFYQFLSIPAGNKRISQWFSSNPWTILAITSVFMVPTSILGWVKVGGDSNNLSPSIYFLYAAFTLAAFGLILGWLNSPCRKTSLGANILLLVIVISLILAKHEMKHNLKALEILGRNETEAAFNYEKKHPGEVYFPGQPLSALMAEGKLYHHTYGVFERRICGFPLTREHFKTYVPPNMRFIAFRGIDVLNLEIMKYFPEFTRIVQIKELDGWIVYSQDKNSENTSY